ncbi:MAG: SpoIID/LytB domain-containing protein [Clostridiales bacterium]|nr:SpoIID/LytB domain-containing protein [Clostridiales bacterium]
MKRKLCYAAAICAAMLFCLESCAASANEPPAQEPKTTEMKATDVRWPKDRLKTGEDGVPLLRVYVDGDIQNMDIESYVEGVLAGEMKNDWPLEALKAQAILARTFVLKFVQEKESKYEGADISTDIEEAQAYDAAGINERIRQAVQETRGQVLVWEGDLPYTWFHAHSGGKTTLAVPGLGWDQEEPGYTASVEGMEPEKADNSKDNEELLKAAKWEASFTPEAFVKACADQGKLITLGADSNLAIGQTGDGGRTVTLTVDGEEVNASELRIALGSTEMRSTLLDEFEMRDGKVYMSGRGYGHGVGMSQWGAYGMAQQGRTAVEIVTHYFADTELAKIW